MLYSPEDTLFISWGYALFWLMQLLAMTHGVNAGEVHFPPRGHFNMMTRGGNYFSLQIELTF